MFRDRAGHSRRHPASVRVRSGAVAWRMRELAAQYPRYGYRRIRIFMERDGFAMSVDRTQRLWKKAKLQVPRKRRRQIGTGRPRPTAPTTQNHVWAIDFVFDTCADGKQLKCLTIVDEWTREWTSSTGRPRGHRRM